MHRLMLGIGIELGARSRKSCSFWFTVQCHERHAACPVSESRELFPVTVGLVINRERLRCAAAVLPKPFHMRFLWFFCRTLETPATSSAFCSRQGKPLSLPEMKRKIGAITSGDNGSGAGGTVVDSSGVSSTGASTAMSGTLVCCEVLADLHGYHPQSHFG